MNGNGLLPVLEVLFGVSTRSTGGGEAIGGGLPLRLSFRGGWRALVGVLEEGGPGDARVVNGGGIAEGVKSRLPCGSPPDETSLTPDGAQLAPLACLLSGGIRSSRR